MERLSDVLRVVLNKTLREPCDHKRRSCEDVGCVVADIREAVGLAARDESTRDELLTALKGAVSLCHCRGKGTYTRPCSMCGDSTFDHACDDDDVDCQSPACVAARAAIAKAEVRP